MKFTCDSCGAQYMISDEKVGPNGVKVRCKKCGNVIAVRRAAAPENGAAAGAPGRDRRRPRWRRRSTPSSASAFDNAFGDTPGADPGRRRAPDPDATQVMGDARTRRASPRPPRARRDRVVRRHRPGPGRARSPLAEVKRKWEGGDVGPDSLVLAPGHGRLGAALQRRRTLARLPRAGAAAPAAARRGPRRAPATDAAPRRAGPTPAPAPAADVTWKPVGATALAALASEEIALAAARPRREAGSRGPAARAA